MIPKIIHYCWLGESKKSPLINKCMKSWKKYLPDYQIKEWNESNIALDHPYLKEAHSQKLWSRMSNLIRLQALYADGGLYLDTDVEVVKSFNPLLDQGCFLGFQRRERHKDWLNNAILGSVPKHPFVKRCMDFLVQECARDKVFYVQPELTTKVLINMGLKEYGGQKIDGVQLYPVEYFFPFAWDEKFSPNCVKGNTYCIHFWQNSWGEKNSLKDQVKQWLVQKYRALSS